MRRLYLLFVSVWVVAAAYAQERTVSGSVSASEDGSLLPGANVVLKGTTQGVPTDVNGAYTITVPGPEAVLVYSYTGRVPQEIVVGDRTSINVQLVSSTKEMREVVVTALGIERETRTLGYSSQQVGGSELTGSRESNAVQGLAAKVAGVQVIQSAGTPGASSKIILRGNRSFTGENQPLFVIDGVPMDNQTSTTTAGDYPFNGVLEQVPYSNRALDLNPEDIESINVLKGPAAAALYGVRAANGALIITTKRARKNQKPVVTYSSSVDVNQVNKLPEFQSTYAQGNPNAAGVPTYITASAGPDGIPGTDDDTPGTPNSWGPKISDVPGLTAHDNVKNFFQTGVTSQNDLSIAAGNENSSYRLSIGQLNQNGIVPNTYYERYSVRLTASTQLAKNLSVFTTVNYTNSSSQMAQQGSNTSGAALALYRAPASYDLSAGYENPNGTIRNYFANYDNPYWTVNKNKFYSNVERLIGNVTVNWDITKFLRLTYRPGVDVYTDDRNQHYAINSHNVTPNTGQIDLNTQTHKEVYQDVILGYNKPINEKITGSINIGSNIDQRTNGDLYARGRALSIPNFYNMANAADRYSSQTQERIRSAAFFYDATIGFNEMLYFNTTGRLEYSSTFGPNRRSFFFPNGNVSFVFTELEPFKSESVSKILSFGKVRAALASSAQTPSPYISRTYYNQPFFTDGFTNGINFPYLGVNGYGRSNVLGNPNLQPEFTTGSEVGLELRFLNNRFSIDATYYNSVTTNAILQRPVPYSSGYAAYWDNSGEIRNHGWEYVINAGIVRTEAFQWDLQVNYTRNINTVKKLTKGVDQQELETGFGDPGAFAVVGQPYGVLYGTYWLRDSASGKLLIDNDGFPIVSSTQKVLASAYPVYTMGIRNTFTYKGLSLSFLIDIKKGGYIWNGTQARLNRVGMSKASGDRDKEYLVEGVRESDGQPNTTKLSAYDYYNFVASDFGATEQNIEDGSWVRLREVSLGYNMPKLSLFNFVQGASITLTGRNLLLWTPYTGVDPETSLTGAGSNIGGFDYFNLPNTRSYSATVRLTF